MPTPASIRRSRSPAVREVDRALTPALVDAMVASAYNVAAAKHPELRSAHPAGMSPAIAATLPRAVRAGWLESYLDNHIHRGEDCLFTAVEVQAALDALQERLL